MPGWRGMFCSRLAGWLSMLTSWLTGSHSQRVVNFCPATAPLLAAREDLGDTKQEVLNKWKLWMFISHHSSSPKTRQKSQDPTSETRLAWLGATWNHRGAVDGPSWVRSWLDGTRLGGSPPPTGWLHSSFLTVFKEPGVQLIFLCQVVTLKHSVLRSRLLHQWPQ